MPSSLPISAQVASLALAWQTNPIGYRSMLVRCSLAAGTPGSDTGLPLDQPVGDRCPLRQDPTRPVPLTLRTSARAGAATAVLGGVLAIGTARVRGHDDVD